MPRRKPGTVLVYVRRSTDKQELGWRDQVGWAHRRAGELHLSLKVGGIDIDALTRQGLHQYGDVYFDSGISGGVLDRPGFQALLARALTDVTVSHVLIHKRDRLGRPSSAVDAMTIENDLAKAGVTIVFKDDIVEPSFDGVSDAAQLQRMLNRYVEGREYLINLAERVIAAQRELAKEGFSTGGWPPYGFARYLVDADGNIVEELAPGRTVRQHGYHVKHLPKDKDKIAVWIHILDLKHAGWGTKRIARHLNDRGVPSPDAGRVRRDHGAAHRVSGNWNHNTVAELCRNAAILGLKQFGRRTEGKYRRHGADGSRELDDRDRSADGRPLVRFTSDDVRITAPTGAEPLFSEDRWREVQRQMDERGTRQRGIPRAVDPGKYPLATRVVDLTDGCGAIMYGVTQQEKKLHKCGRYIKSGGTDCHHNSADAEALLRVVLAELRQAINRSGGHGLLRSLLEQRAQAAATLPKSPREGTIELLEQRISQLEAEKATIQSRMAREMDDARYEALGQEFDKSAEALADAICSLKAERIVCPPQGHGDPQSDVDAAMRLLDQIEVLATDGAARGQIQPLLERLGIWVGLSFDEALKGKRKVRRLRGGIMCFGGYHLPVPLHGADNIDPTSTQQGPDRSQNEQGTARDRASVNPTQPAQGDPAEKPWIPDGSRHREGVSLSKVSRGDLI